MEAAGENIDFYVVHNYGSNGDVAPEDVLEIPGRDWPRITGDVRDGYADHGIDDVPIAVTEHNLVAFFDGDDERLMTTALNAFYLAETIGQMAANGVTIANQWNMANGRAPTTGPTTAWSMPTPSCAARPIYAMALWSRFGDELVAGRCGHRRRRTTGLRRSPRRRIGAVARGEPVRRPDRRHDHGRARRLAGTP